GRSQFGLVLADVLIGVVPRQDVGNTRAAGRCLEAVVLRDHVIGQNRPVAPAADSQPLRIGDPLPNSIIHRCQHVLPVLVPPVGIDGRGKALAAADCVSAVAEESAAPGASQVSPNQGVYSKLLDIAESFATSRPAASETL